MSPLDDRKRPRTTSEPGPRSAFASQASVSAVRSQTLALDEPPRPAAPPPPSGIHGEQESRPADSSLAWLPLGNDLGTLIAGCGRFPIVAPAATRSALLLRGAAGPKRQRGVGLISRRGGPWFVDAEVSDGPHDVPHLLQAAQWVSLPHCLREGAVSRSCNGAAPTRPERSSAATPCALSLESAEAVVNERGRQPSGGRSIGFSQRRATARAPVSHSAIPSRLPKSCSSSWSRSAFRSCHRLLGPRRGPDR